MTFWFAVWGNLQIVCVIVTVIAIASSIFSTIAWSVHAGLDEKAAALSRRVLRWSLAGAFAFGLLSSIPSADDLWRARIALVKYELASPENVKAGAAEIQRIAHALECKYLDTCEEKKP